MTESLNRADGRRTTVARLVTLVLPYWPQILIGAVAVVGAVAIQLVFPFLFGKGLIDEVLIEQVNIAYLNLIAAGAIALVLAKGVFFYIKTYAMAYAGNRLVVDLRSSLYSHLQRMSLAFHERKRTGEMVSRVTNDVTLIQNSVTSGIADLIYDTLLLGGILVAVLWLHWKLAVVTLLFFPLVGVAISKYGARIRKYSRIQQEKVSDIGAILQETLSGIRVVKAFTMEEDRQKRFDEENEQSFGAGMKSVQMMAAVTPVVELLLVAGMVFVIWYGAHEVIKGRLTAGELITFLTYIGMATTPINGITRTFNSFQQALSASDRVFDLIDERDEVKEAPDAIPAGKFSGEVEFCGVSFGYEKDRLVLEKIDLRVAPGEVVALVGPSGAGKTSLANLIPRFYDPVEGQVKIDGTDVRQYRIKDLRRQIGLVPQETVLFGVSIAENIAYGKPGASEEEIERAARMANAHEFILKLPRGYDTVVGERGCTLSGGQRQRIAIARAILRNPSVLIFDEATSALDAESEAAVQSALGVLMKGRTTFVIAHRLSTIMNADRIVVLDGGRIVEMGSHSELLRKNGLYSRLYNAQFSEDAGLAWTGLGQA